MTVKSTQKIITYVLVKAPTRKNQKNIFGVSAEKRDLDKLKLSCDLLPSVVTGNILNQDMKEKRAQYIQ